MPVMSIRPPIQPLSRTRFRVLLALALTLSLPACSKPLEPVQSRELRLNGDNYQVVTLHLDRDRLGLYWRNPRTGDAFGGIEALRNWGRARGQRLLFATNAGIYDRKHAPLGLYVENGKRLIPLNTVHGDPRAGNFSLQPNGVFLVDDKGHATVETTAAYAARHAHVRLATQSGPMLVIDGRINPNFHQHSDSLKWRSGVCARHGNQVMFAVSDTPVNFYSFAQVFRDRLDCRNALYLDGSISQLYVNDAYYGAPSFMVQPYAAMFGVFAAPASATTATAQEPAANVP